MEELDLKTRNVLIRRWKGAGKSSLGIGSSSRWEYEIGEPANGSGETKPSLLSASSSAPVFVALDFPQYWEWQVRNIAFPLNVYSLSLDEEKQELVLRTSTKKYFKRFAIPTMRRFGRKLEEGEATLVGHEKNILTIRYPKPADVAAQEVNMRKDQLKLSLGSSAPGNTGPGDCKQQ